MSVGKLISLNLDQIDPDVRAYIHQQVNDLQPYFAVDSKVKVYLTQPDVEREEIVAKMILTGYDHEVECRGRGQDIYEAVRSAKEEMLKYFSTIEIEMALEIESHEAEIAAAEAADEDEDLKKVH